MAKKSKLGGAIGFGWRRTGDASVVAWAWPTAWSKVITALGGVGGGALAYFQHAPLWLWPVLVLGMAVVILIAMRVAVLMFQNMGESEASAGVDNTRGFYVGGDNSGTQNVFHGPVYQAVPATGSTPPGQFERDTKLKHAIKFIVTGRWDSPNLLESEPGVIPRMEAALNQLSQFAADGKLHAWARNYTTTIYEPIPAPYWTKTEIDFLSLFRDAAFFDEDKLVTPIYRDVMVSRAEVEKLWPPLKRTVPDKELEELAGVVVFLAHSTNQRDYGAQYRVALRDLKSSRHVVWVDQKLNGLRTQFLERLSRASTVLSDDKAYRQMHEISVELSTLLNEKARD